MIEVSRKNGGKKNCFGIFPPFPLHLYFLPLAFESQTQSCLAPAKHMCPVLPPGLSCACDSCLAWHQHNEAPALWAAECPDLGQSSSCPQEDLFHISQLILWSPEEEHPLLLLSEKKYKTIFSLLVKILLIKTALIWSHCHEALGFPLTLISSRCFPQLTGPTCSSDSSAENVLSLSKLQECFSEPDHGQFNILPEMKGQGGYLSCVAPREVEAVDIKWSL